MTSQGMQYLCGKNKFSENCCLSISCIGPIDLVRKSFEPKGINDKTYDDDKGW